MIRDFFLFTTLAIVYDPQNQSERKRIFPLLSFNGCVILLTTKDDEKEGMNERTSEREQDCKHGICSRWHFE